MAIIRVQHTKDYTVMANFHLRDRNLSLKAKGIMSFMLALPDTWDFSMEGLATCSRDGVDSVRSALKELEDSGYLVRSRARDEKGKVGKAIYDLYEKPALEKPILENPIQDKPILDKPILEKQAQINTNLSNTNELNTNLSNTKIDIVQEQEEPIPYAEIITYFNEVAGTHYLLRGREIKRFIKARWNDGFRLEDFKTVLDKKTAQWKNDAKMSKYLRFETLFSNKFESYLNEVVAFNKSSYNPMNPSGSRYTEEELNNLDLLF